MDKNQRELVRNIERKLGHISQECERVAENDVLIKAIQNDLDEIQETMKTVEEILNFYRSIKKAVRWFIVLLFTATITTVVNHHVNQSLKQRDEPKPPIITVTTGSKE